MSELVTVGVDVGTSAVKVAVVASPPGSGRARAGARTLAVDLERLRKRDAHAVVEMVLRRAYAAAGIEARDVAYLASTGEADGIPERTGHFYGMTTHARGGLFLDPTTRAILDVGALHGRAVKMDEASKVLGYRMTSQCASGSGQFLENIARYLGVAIDEIGELSAKAEGSEKISGICAVLAETDVINMVSRGITIDRILRGIHDSMAARLVKLLQSLGVEGTVLLTGGLSRDAGLLAAIRAALAEGRRGGRVEVRTHPDAVHAGALGAALWGAYRAERLERRDAEPERAEGRDRV